MDIMKKMKDIFKTNKAKDVASDYTEKDPRRKALMEEKAKATDNFIRITNIIYAKLDFVKKI